MSPAEPLWQGRVLIVSAAMLWSTSGFFAQAPWFDDWPEESRGALLAFFRSLFAFVILAPLIRKVEFRPAMIPMVICFATMVWTFMSAMVYGSAANTIWLQYLAPAWVIAGSVLLLKERVGKQDVQMFLFCITGVALILAMELRNGNSLLATQLAILSGVGFAGVVLCMRTMSDVDPLWLISLNHAATAVILLPWAWNAHQPIATPSYLALAAFGVFQMSVPYFLFARGLRTVPSAEASMLTLIEPVLVPTWVYLAWHHHPSYVAPAWWTIAGGTLILIGLVRRYLPLLLRRAARDRSD